MSWLAYPSWLNAGDNAWQMTAATFVGLMSLFNMAGRFFWASTSDYLGRRMTNDYRTMMPNTMSSPVAAQGAA